MIQAQRRNSSAKNGASHLPEQQQVGRPAPLRKRPILLALAAIILTGWLIFLAFMAFRE